MSVHFTHVLSIASAETHKIQHSARDEGMKCNINIIFFSRREIPNAIFICLRDHPNMRESKHVVDGLFLLHIYSGHNRPTSDKLFIVSIEIAFLLQLQAISLTL